MVACSNSPLDASVLVLNKLFMAVHVISVRRAFVLLCKELAEVVSMEDGQYATYDFQSWREISEYRLKNFQYREEEDDWVRTASTQIQVPRVIRLLAYEKIPRHTVKFNRRNIFARDNNQCQYCGKRQSTSDLSLDHVVPRSRGGRTTWSNVVTACQGCNLLKGNRLPHQSGMHPKSRPAQPTTFELQENGRAFPPNYLHQSWRDFLYWDTELDPG